MVSKQETIGSSQLSKPKISKQHDAEKSFISHNFFGFGITKLAMSLKEHVFAERVTLVVSIFCPFKTNSNPRELSNNYVHKHEHRLWAKVIFCKPIK